MPSPIFASLPTPFSNQAILIMRDAMASLAVGKKTIGCRGLMYPCFGQHRPTRNPVVPVARPFRIVKDGWQSKHSPCNQLQKIRYFEAAHSQSFYGLY
jgi:hypothetical protein